MKLSELMEYITYSEVANLFVSGEEEGKVRPRHYPKIISNLNVAMIELHKRFPILVKAATIQLYEHITMYYLHSDYAYTNTASTKPYKYLIDSATDPFTNDVMKIMRVYDEDCDEYPLNIENDESSFYTPSQNVLQVPFPNSDTAVAVEYQAYPGKIPTDTSDLDSVEVQFPEVLIEPLLSFLSYKLFSGVGLEKPEAIAYLQKYEADCIKVDQFGVYNRDRYTNMNLENNGWV